MIPERTGKEINMNKIKSAIADYTGGGIYVYFGQLTDGRCFLTDDDSEEDVLILNADVNENYDDAFYSDWQEAHTIGHGEITYEEIIKWIITNQPEGNYQTGELENRLNK